MKKLVIFLLVCLNAALLFALLSGSSARAQGFFTTDYLLLTGKQAGSQSDAIYVIDLAKARLAGLKFNRAKMEVEPIGVRDLRKDFQRREIRP